ncbi:peptidoglycan-binding protein [Streptomyces sp. NPDC002644]
MATPMTPAQWLAALRAEGINVAERSGWTTHERDDETGKAFGPVHGVLIHHTAGSNTLNFCWTGSSALPGPLCHTHLSKTGKATMLSAGRANHAGLVAKNAFDAVYAESSTHPKPSAASGTVDGNDCFYGIEIENLGTGSDPYPSVQYDAAVRWAAAICRHHGWTADSVVGHKETSIEGKIDPSFDMNKFRADVKARLAGTPAPAPAPVAKHEPFPGVTFFKRAPRSAVITAMGKRLVAEGYKGYNEGPGPQWTDADRQAYAWWQRKLGYRGTAADGWPGRASWDKLRVPNV